MKKTNTKNVLKAGIVLFIVLSSVMLVSGAAMAKDLQTDIVEPAVELDRIEQKVSITQLGIEQSEDSNPSLYGVAVVIAIVWYTDGTCDIFILD